MLTLASLTRNIRSTACRTLTLGVAAAAIALPAGVAMADRPCPVDTNCSGAVDVDDLIAVILGWGQSGSADVDGSGTVDVDDLIAVILGWGPCVFDYGPDLANEEAVQIGLEMLGSAGPLTVSNELYTRIDRDLGLIRTAHPALATETHSGNWLSTSMLVAVIQGLPTTELDCLNTYYGVTSMTLLFSSGGTDYYVASLPDPVNVPALGEIYGEAPEVAFAEPDGLIGGQNYWVPTDMGGGVWRWQIDDGFWDCFDGCDCHRLYTIDIDADGNVTLVNYEEWGQKWCPW